jgi:hypothetical protein
MLSNKEKIEIIASIIYNEMEKGKEDGTELCKAFVALHDNTIGIAEADVQGYNPTGIKADSYKEAQDLADLGNELLKYSVKEAFMVVISSMNANRSY